MTEQELLLKEGEDSIDIKSIIDKLLAHWYLFLIVPILSVACGFLYTNITNTKYKLSSSLIVKDDNAQPNLGDMFGAADIFQKKSNLDNKIEIIKSYKLNESAYNNLNLSVSYFESIGLKDIELYKNTPFEIKYTPATKLTGEKIKFKRIGENQFEISFDGEYTSENLITEYVQFCETIQLGGSIQNEHISITLLPTAYKIKEGTDYYFTIHNKNKHIKAIMKRLSIGFASKKASVINTSIIDNVPLRAVDYLNALSSQVIKYGLEEKNEISLNTLKFIDNQLTGIVDSLGIAETQLLKFRSQNNVVNISAQGTLLFNRSEKLMEQKAEFSRTLAYFEYLEKYLKNKNHQTDIISPATMGVGDQILAELTKEHNVIRNEMASMSVAAHEINPSMVMLKTRLENVRATIEENLKGQVQVAKQGLTEINKQIGFIDAQLIKLPKNESELLNIQRKYTLNNELYTFLLQKRAETGISLASNLSDISTIDIARTENAEIISFKKPIIYLISLILGLIIPIVMIYLKSLLNSKIESIQYLEKNLRVPIVASLGKNNYKKDLVVSKHPNSAIAESFRVLRSNLRYLSTKGESKVVIITSTIPGEGKSFTSTNLSSIIAMSKQKVLLVGLDLRKPVLHNYFDVSQQRGLSTFLISKNSYEEIITPTEVKNLDIVPSGPIPPNPSELIDSKKMAEFIELAKKDYDYIILDTPPVGLVGDVLQLSKYSDIILHMIRYKHSKQDAVKFINDLNDKHHINNINVVFNGVKAKGIYGTNYGYGMEYYAEEKTGFLHNIKKLFKK